MFHDNTTIKDKNYSKMLKYLKIPLFKRSYFPINSNVDKVKFLTN